MADTSLPANGPHTVPIAHPLSNSTPAAPAALTVDQRNKFNWLLTQARSWTEIPSTKAGNSPPTPAEKLWLTRECLLRYLRATKWTEKESEKRLLATLIWRRDFGVYDKLTPDYISPENATGKQVILGYDNEGRPCHYLNPGRQNTEPSQRQVEHLVFMVERVIELMPPKQETLALLINFKPSKTRTNTSPGIGQAREVLNILQTHYPERLGRAMPINLPWIVNGFFKLITPFIDPMTRVKLKFNADVRQHVPPQQLWTEFNGDLKFDYDHDVYWPALMKLSQERKAAWTQRWEAGGSHIGETEDYLKGVDATGVQGPEQQSTGPPVSGSGGIASGGEHDITRSMVGFLDTNV